LCFGLAAHYKVYYRHLKMFVGFYMKKFLSVLATICNLLPTTLKMLVNDFIWSYGGEEQTDRQTDMRHH
jgi:hypothetical protein